MKLSPALALAVLPVAAILLTAGKTPGHDETKARTEHSYSHPAKPTASPSTKPTKPCPTTSKPTTPTETKTTTTSKPHPAPSTSTSTPPPVVETTTPPPVQTTTPAVPVTATPVVVKMPMTPVVTQTPELPNTGTDDIGKLVGVAGGLLAFGGLALGLARRLRRAL